MKLSAQLKYPTTGFTLVELMISLTVGLILFAGVLSIFVGIRTTTEETSSYGELQENGRFAISILADDLLKQNFFGDFTGIITASSVSVDTDGAPGNDCQGGGVNNTSFPSAIGHFRTLWGQTVLSADPMSCFSDAHHSSNSDLLQLKRVVTTPLPLTAGDTAADKHFYFISNNNEAIIFKPGIVPDVENSRVWQYQHRVYYVRNESQGSNSVPVLMQGKLSDKMTFSPIIDGIEIIRFMYGVDRDTDPTSAGYGTIDAFIAASDMSDHLWDNAGGTRILAVKIYVLARSILPDNDYRNTSTYNLGNLAFTVNDNYRRLLFTSTVKLYNSTIDSW